MNTAEKIKQLESKLVELEERKISRKRTYDKGMESLNAEANVLKARLYDLEHSQKK